MKVKATQKVSPVRAEAIAAALEEKGANLAAEAWRGAGSIGKPTRVYVAGQMAADGTVVRPPGLAQVQGPFAGPNGVEIYRVVTQKGEVLTMGAGESVGNWLRQFAQAEAPVMAPRTEVPGQRGRVPMPVSEVAPSAIVEQAAPVPQAARPAFVAEVAPSPAPLPAAVAEVPAAPIVPPPVTPSEPAKAEPLPPVTAAPPLAVSPEEFLAAEPKVEVPRETVTPTSEMPRAEAPEAQEKPEAVEPARTIPPARETVVEAPKAKEPWEMTREEWQWATGTREPGSARTVFDRAETKALLPEDAARGVDYVLEGSLLHHKGSVIKALREGKPVPTEVLADYPDLKASVSEKDVREREVTETADDRSKWYFQGVRPGRVGGKSSGWWTDNYGKALVYARRPDEGVNGEIWAVRKEQMPEYLFTDEYGDPVPREKWYKHTDQITGEPEGEIIKIPARRFVEGLLAAGKRVEGDVLQRWPDLKPPAPAPVGGHPAKRAKAKKEVAPEPEPLIPEDVNRIEIAGPALSWQGNLRGTWRRGTVGKVEMWLREGDNMSALTEDLAPHWKKAEAAKPALEREIVEAESDLRTLRDRYAETEESTIEQEDLAEQIHDAAERVDRLQAEAAKTNPLLARQLGTEIQVPPLVPGRQSFKRELLDEAADLGGTAADEYVIDYERWIEHGRKGEPPEKPSATDVLGDRSEYPARWVEEAKAEFQRTFDTESTKGVAEIEKREGAPEEAPEAPAVVSPEPAPKAEPAPPAPKPEAKPMASAIPTPTDEAEEAFQAVYKAQLARLSEEREKVYPSAQLMKDWKTLDETGTVQVYDQSNQTRGAMPSKIRTETRTEGRGKKRKTIRSYVVETSKGHTYTFDWENDKDWAGAKALARASGLAEQRYGWHNDLHTAMVHEGDYVTWHERQFAIHEALEAALPGKTIPQLSTIVKVSKNPTLKETIAAVAESLPRNLGNIPERRSAWYGFDENYAKEVEKALASYEQQVREAAAVVGEKHPRVEELQGLIDERRTALQKERKEHEQKQSEQRSKERAQAETDARNDAEYYARFGTTDDRPLANLEKYANLSGWEETGPALNERALREFGIEKRQLKPLDLSDMKLKKSDLDILREVRLQPDGTLIPRRLTIGQEEEWKARGWLDEKGIQLTETGERAVLGVHAAEAQDLAGRPMSEYNPGSGRAPSPGSGRFALTAPIPYKGDVWHTDGHMLVLGPPPKYWEAPKEVKTLPDISRVMPTEDGTTVKPVGFAVSQSAGIGKVVFFSGGQGLSALLYDYVNKTHSPDKWTATGKGNALQAWKAGKRVALVMPVRWGDKESELPPRIQELLKNPPAEPVKPTGGHPARRKKTTVGAGTAGMATAVRPGLRGGPPGTAARPATGLTEPVSRTQILQDIAARFGELPIRTGRFRDRALGIYKVHPEVVRTKFPEDLPVAFHEIGHHINKLLWGVSRVGAGLNWRPLRPFRGELEPIATEPKAGQSKLPEGFAEFIRMYVTDATAAQAAAPNFYRWFENLLDQPENADLKETLLNARAQVDRYINQPALAYMNSMIQHGDDSKPWLTWEGFMTGMVEATRPIKTAVEWMADKNGTDVPSDNAYDQSRIIPGVVEKSNFFLEYGAFDPGDPNLAKIPGVKPLKEILEPIKDRLQEFDIYLAAKRAEELEAAGIKSGFDMPRVRQALNDLGDLAPYKTAATDFYVWEEAVRDYLVRRRMISQAQADAMDAKWVAYAPFYRVFRPEEKAPGRRGPGRRGQLANVGQPIKKIRGSERAIHSPLESAVKNLFTFISAAERNHVGRALVNQAENTEGAGWLVERVPGDQYAVKVPLEEIKKTLEDAGADVDAIDLDLIATIFRPTRRTPKDEPIISVIEDGKARYYQVEPELYKAMLGLDEETANLFVKLIEMPARWLRTGATGLSLRFMLRNPIRDAMTAFVQSEHGFKPGWDTVRGIFHVLGKDELYQEWLRSGAPHSAMVSIDRQHLERAVNELMQNGVRWAVRHPVEALRSFSEVTEAATRVQEYALARKQGKAPLQAAVASQNVTLPFQRRGNWVRAVNRIIPFFSANVNGAEMFARIHRDALRFRRGPRRLAGRGKYARRALIRAMLGITIPSILLYLLNRNRKEYQEQPRWLKDLFWLIPTGDDKIPFVTIPKPFVWGQVYGSVPERVMEWIDERDPKAFDRIGRTLYESASPGAIPTALIIPVEWATNYNWFTGRPVEPGSGDRAQVSPQYRAWPWTSQFSRASADTLAKAGIQVSPAKLDNALRGIGGGAAQDVLAATDWLFGKATGQEKVSRGAVDIPVVGAFTARWPTMQAESIERLRNRTRELRQKVTDWKKVKGAPMPTPAERGELSRLEAEAKRISNINQRIRKLQEDGGRPADQRKQEIDRLTQEAIRIARRAMGLAEAPRRFGHPARRAAR